MYPTLGSKVWVTATLHRESKVAYFGTEKTWSRKELSQRKQGWYMGWRTLSEGLAAYSGSEEGHEYRQTRHLTAYLVVFGPRSKPVFVDPKDCEVIEHALEV